MKRQATDWEKIVVKDKSDKGPIQKMQRIPELNNKKTANEFKKQWT